MGIITGMDLIIPSVSGGVKRLVLSICPSVCVSVQCNLAIHRVKGLLNPTITLQSPPKIYVHIMYLIEIRAFYCRHFQFVLI